MFAHKLSELEAAERELVSKRHALEGLRARPLDLPDSVGQLRQLLEEGFRKLALESPEFGEFLRPLVPRLDVYLVRLCDGGHLFPRARVELALGGGVPDARHVPGLGQLLRRERTLDLFEPPQRERIRAEAVRLAAHGLRQRKIAARLPGKPTPTAVQRALALHEKMSGLGLATPYLPVLEPPPDYPKLRRHKNGKYRFRPLPGYQPRAL
jgi:hypothetical protein